MARVSIGLSDRDLQTLEQIAASEGATVEDLVQQAIRNFLVAHAEPDPDWQSRFDEVIGRIQNRIPPDIAPEEIEADVRAARAEVREARRARGR
jgi:hypothetical protein